MFEQICIFVALKGTKKTRRNNVFNCVMYAFVSLWKSANLSDFNLNFVVNVRHVKRVKKFIWG